VEERPLAKENTEQSNPGRTQSPGKRDKWAGTCAGSSEEGWEGAVHGPTHHVTVDLLRDSYNSLKKRLRQEWTE